MQPITPDRSEIVRLGKVLLPVMHATRPSLPPYDHETWLNNAPCLLLLFNDYARKHGYRCTHGQIKHNGMHRHHVIFSDGAGNVFEAEAESEQLAAARAAERLILKRV
jgi:hypothetical protein